MVDPTQLYYWLLPLGVQIQMLLKENNLVTFPTTVYLLHVSGNLLIRIVLGRKVHNEGTYVYLWLIYVDIWQETNTGLSNNYCPVKNKFKKKRIVFCFLTYC